MGLFDYIKSFFNFNLSLNPIECIIEKTLDQPCDDRFSSSPSAKRFKPNHHYPNLSNSILDPIGFGNMSPKQYFQSKRKVPTPRRPPPIVQINETDDDEDCQIINNEAARSQARKNMVPPSVTINSDDEIQVLQDGMETPSGEVATTSSPCSSRPRIKIISKKMVEPEVYPIDEDDDDRGSNNKENNGQSHENQNKSNEGDDEDEVEVLDSRPKPITKRMQINSMFPRWSSVDCGSNRPLLSAKNSGSNFLFKKKQPQERQNTLKQIQKLQSREDYAKLIQAITHLSSSSSNETTLPSSSRNSSTPSCSEVDALDRLTSHPSLSSTSGIGRHVSVNVGNKTRSYIDIGKPSISTARSNDVSSRNQFRFLNPGPQSGSRIPVVRMSGSSSSSQNKEDKLDAMIRRIQSIDLHRFDNNISRQALALEKTNEKVRSLEVPSYNVLLEKTINLRKVPERLQLKKAEPQLPEITEEMEVLVKRMKASGRMDMVVSKVGLEEITKDQILSLQGLTWLKDNVINCYMALLMERSKTKEGKLPRIYGFNTFFHSALHEHGYGRVKRWTKKVDLFSYDLLLVPIHVQKIHWCLATVDFRKKCLTYYDSMAGPDRGCLQRLLKYLGDESMDKKKTPFDISSWSMQCPKDVPQQQNSCDCGVFTSTFAEYLARNADISKVKQDDMPYYRKKMMVEILMKKLLT